MKLKKAQREILLQWAAEGLESDEINKRAAQFKPRFKVTRQQVDHYRKSRGVKLGEIRETGETNALKTGFAVKENRIAALKQLADKMFDELNREEDNRRWTKNAKGLGSGEEWERYDYEEFNKAEVDALRGVLDDIASELGERRPGVQVNNFNFNNEEIMTRITALLAKAEERMKNAG